MTETNIEEIVNQLTNTVATSNSYNQLGVRVDLQHGGHRSACWIEETNTNLGNTTTVVPNPKEYIDLRVSPLQGSATSLVLPHDLAVFITYSNPENDFTPIDGYAFSVGKDGNITSYQTVTINFFRNTVTKTSERTECPAVYQVHVKKLISETYADVQKTVETRKELLKYMPHIAETGFSQNPDLDGYILQCFRNLDELSAKTKDVRAEIADVERQIRQLKTDFERDMAQQKAGYSSNEPKPVVEQPQPSPQSTNPNLYYGIGSAFVVTALLAAIAIKKFYPKK